MGKKFTYIKKQYDMTRRMPATWNLGSYKYKFNFTHMMPFLDGLKQKKIIGLMCRACNRVTFPPQRICGNCLVKFDKWVPLRDTGVVATFTQAYVKDKATGTVEVIPVVAVRQDGSDSTFLATLNPEIKFEDIYVGMPVKIKWKEETNGDLKDIEYYDLVEDITKDMDLMDDEA
ncbi:MAG: Zn-ribbon domain-containing OB-fold protein [Candidatus Hodarchaeota archaeon]